MMITNMSNEILKHLYQETISEGSFYISLTQIELRNRFTENKELFDLAFEVLKTYGYAKFDPTLGKPNITSTGIIYYENELLKRQNHQEQ